ncbi:hypothetical protein B0J17DRAFT_655212 [Rhizoctonia solani]|nr:hypothetical protein B0J17DRAFT_655212 [Rhizoctonia solani]
MASLIEKVKEVIPGVGQTSPEGGGVNKPDESPLSPRTSEAKLKLEKSLKERPEKQVLVDRDILRNDGPLSPRAVEAKLKLEKSLKERPEKQELVDRHILKDSKVAPSLQAAQDKLERAQLENKLEKALEGRPKPEELVNNGILNKDEVPPSH